MRLSREKTVRLSHVITDVLVAGEDVEFIEDRATIRQNVVEILLSLLRGGYSFLEVGIPIRPSPGRRSRGLSPRNFVNVGLFLFRAAFTR